MHYVKLLEQPLEVHVFVWAQKQGLFQVLEVHFTLTGILGRCMAFKKPKKRRQTFLMKDRAHNHGINYTLRSRTPGSLDLLKLFVKYFSYKVSPTNPTLRMPFLFSKPMYKEQWCRSSGSVLNTFVWFNVSVIHTYFNVYILI